MTARHRQDVALVAMMVVIFALFAIGARADEVAVSSLDLKTMHQDWGNPRSGKSVDSKPMKIAGQSFTSGIGTHATSEMWIDLKGGGERFTAQVGVDDDVENNPAAAVKFIVLGDDKELFNSGVMKAGEAPKPVDVDLHGVKTVKLEVQPGADDISFDHADWAEAKIQYTGEKPAAIEQPTEPAVILTPKPPATPRINGPRIYGERPGKPFLFTIAATGDRPMTFSADNLPTGLSLDASTGRITGSVAERGEFLVTLHAKNAAGSIDRPLHVIIGDQIALTPPMGWNSWNCFARAVDDAKVRAAADSIVRTGLINHGWTYVNIDDTWEGQRDASGNIQSNDKFPDMKALADYVHSKGLKIGIYSSPGPQTCAKFEGSYQHEQQDAKTWADWGFDYIKYDWCSYGKIAKDKSLPELQKPYKVMQDALGQVNRDILYSFCQYGMGDVWTWGAEFGGNCWRTTGDINDSWGSMARIGFSQSDHAKYAGPGHWNDPDMLVVGKVGWGPKLHPTRLTPNEQYTHISLWCLLDAPLLIGCDLTQIDDFTMSLLTNDEVLDVNQDPLGKQASKVGGSGTIEVWAKDMEDGSKAVGIFNRGRAEATGTAQFSELGIQGKQVVRDLWRQQDVGTFENEYHTQVPGHGVVLVRIRPAK